MQQFQIAGRLGSDPKTSNGCTTLRVAVNNGPVTDWFWVVAFKEFGLRCAKLSKGDGVALGGYLTINTHNGTDKVELVATTGHFFRKTA